MLITENRLRKIIAEEYSKLKMEGGEKEADPRPIMYHGKDLRKNSSLYSQSGGGASNSEAAMQILFSIFYKKTPEDFEKAPELKRIAKEQYDKLSAEFGKEAVDAYVNKHKLNVLMQYV
jgi:hypothetical protein